MKNSSSTNNKRGLGILLSTKIYDQNHNKDVMGSPRKKPRLHDTPLALSERTNTQDLISHLPDECIVAIFSFLASPRDRCSCSAVSKKWLLLQANMRNSEFKSNLKVSDTGVHDTDSYKISRCLEGKKANDTRLAAIAVGICPRGGLNELVVRGSLPAQGITDIGLGIIAQACPSLKSLSLWDCTKARNKGIESIAEGCNSLEKLDLVSLPFVDDSSLIAIARNCPCLSTLNIESCPLIGNRSLEAFGRYSSKLESLSLVKCPLVGDQAIVSVISSSPKLSKLKLVSVRVSDGVLEEIGRHGRSLSCLALENLYGITQLGFCLLGVQENLKFLSLKSCSGLCDTSFRAIGEGFIGLNQILIRKCDDLTDKGLKELTKSTSLLETLKLEECIAVTWNGLIEVFANCSETLKTLSLVRCRGITDESSIFKQTNLSKYPSLYSLKLKKCYRIGDAFMAWIGHACAQVKHLNLIGLRSVTDQGVVTLTKKLKTDPKSLVSVALSGCSRITDWSVFAITSLVGEKLRSLMLDGCEGLSDKSLKMIAECCPCLRDLDLSRCDISDDGVLCLATSKQQCLEVLSLAGCVTITDHSLRYLELMRGSLMGLNFKNCPRLTKEGLDSVRNTLISCDLVF